jgi:hypothetical protein
MQSTAEQASGLFKYFVVITHEQHLEQVSHQFKQQRESYAELEECQKLEELAKVDHKQAKARECK